MGIGDFNITYSYLLFKIFNNTILLLKTIN